MKAFICLDGPGWEAVIRGAARYLGKDEVVLAHAIDERASQGYELSVRGLLGRRSPRPRSDMATISETAARELLADAEVLLGQLRSELSIETLLLRGLPEEELVRAAREQRANAVFVSRRNSETEQAITVSGVVRDWKRNPHGNLDGFYLEEGTEVGFPPHQASEIQAVVDRGTVVEAWGKPHGRRLHAYRITDVSSGASVEAHKPPGKRTKEHLGHTARFIVDHVPCDAVILQPRS